MVINKQIYGFVKRYWLTLAIVLIILIIIYIIYLLYKHYTKKRILLIADNVFNSNKRAEKYLLHKNVYHAFYNEKKIVGHYDILEIIDEVMKQNNLKRGDLASVGFMYHSPGKNELGMFENANIVKVLADNTSLDNIKKYDDFILFARLINCRTGSPQMDMICCSLVEKTHSKLFEYIDKHAHIQVNASTGITGGEGDWNLEQGDRELIGRYFNNKIRRSDIRLIA